jgi:hypothetical protein
MQYKSQKVFVRSTQDVDIWMEIPIQDDVYIWANNSVSSYLNFIPIFWNVLIWLKYDFMHHLPWSLGLIAGPIWKMSCNNLLLSHILLQYVRFCMSNNSRKSVLVICPRNKYPYNNITTVNSVTNTWSTQQTPMFHGCTITNKQNVEPWKLF